MKKFILLFILLLGVLVISGCNSDSTGNLIESFDEKVTVYKEKNCGCCGLYSHYLKSKGKIDVKVVDTLDMNAIKKQYSVPSILESCHTTIIGDYFVEGHIPLEAINKLVTEKPDIAGIAMAGMPSGSPGMTGVKNSDFTIYAVNNDGSQDVFMIL